MALSNLYYSMDAKYGHVLKPGTLQNTPEHQNTGTVEKTWNTDFDGVVLLSHYRPCKK